MPELRKNIDPDPTFIQSKKYYLIILVDMTLVLNQFLEKFCLPFLVGSGEKVPDPDLAGKKFPDP